MLREVLEATMGLLEQTLERQAEGDEQLADLREAASILVFRVFFVVTMESRGLLYEKPPRAGAKDSPFLHLQDLATAIRDKHASIFRNRPTDDFSPGLAAWLDGLDAATPKLAKDIDRLREWDRLIARLEPLARMQPVLGDVYEQILAMVPVRSGKGKVALIDKAAQSERKALGAHYTPEALVTEVVLAALEPVFAAAWTRAGEQATGYARELLDLRVLDPAMGSAHFLTVAALEIARELAWAEVFGRPRDPEWFEVWPEKHEPADREQLDRVAARWLPKVIEACCHGVDVNPLAVELGKLALWMLTVDSNPLPLTFLDKNLRCGDSLRGTTEARVRECFDDVYGTQRWTWDLAFLFDWYGRNEYALKLALTDDKQAAQRTLVALLGGTGKLTKAQRTHRERVRTLAAGLRAFHWPLEFHEVFHRESRGFDMIVTNPPFLGDRDLRKRFGEDGVAYLRTAFTGGATVDLTGFFMLAFDSLLNERGVAGTVAPNTLAQAKNRREVLVPLVATAPTKFEIYRSCASRVWPGDAAVHVLTVHLRRPHEGLRASVRKIIDTNRLGFVAMKVDERISSYLDDGPETDMFALPGQEAPIAFVGMFPRGDFDRPVEFLDGLPKRERAAVFAYLNNRDVQQQPAPVARRVIIDVADAIAKAGLADSGSRKQESWLKTNLPTLYKELARSVKSERKSLPDSARNKRAREFWWAFEEVRPGLRAAWAGLEEFIIVGRTGKHLKPAFVRRISPDLNCRICPTDKLYVVPTMSLGVFAVFTSFSMELMTRRLCSTLKSDMNFAPSDVLPYFPFPWATTVLNVPTAVEHRIAPPAQALLDLRKDILLHPERHDLTRTLVGGPTDLYNLFDDPTCATASIQRLRAAHHELERAVLHAYGWEDLHGPWTFERPWIDGTWRHVPPAATRRAYLTRLAELNHARASSPG